MSKLEDLTDNLIEKLPIKATEIGWEAIGEDVEEYKQAITALLKVEVAKARHEGFLGAKVACSFNSNCNNCHANKLSLDFLVEPETAEVESNGDTSTTTATMPLPEIPIHKWAYYSSGQRTCSLCKLRQVRPIGGDWEVESNGL